MPVKLNFGASVASSLTSPPEHPDPQPPEELIAKKVSYGDRDIFVTHPFPDSIELITDVFNHHMLSPDATGASVKKVYQAIDQEMLEWVEGYKTGEVNFSPAPKVQGTPPSSVVYRIAYDPLQPLNRATLTLSRRASEDFGIWSVRLEFSARKAGTSGLLKLISGLDAALPLQVDKLLGSFRVSRVDPAVDLIGAEPIDLIAHVQKPGKRLVYVGEHGRPESLYLYEAKKPLKAPPKAITYNTRGPLRLKLYERRDYMLQLMLQPPYGPAPVTRAELEVRWKKKSQRPLLSMLAGTKNPFLGRRVAYAMSEALLSEVKDPDRWVHYCLAALGGGTARAQAKLPVGLGVKLRKLYDGCAGDLIAPDCWSTWVQGIEATGLSEWVSIAKANPPPGP